MNSTGRPQVSVPNEGTLVRTVCESQAISAIIPVDQAQQVNTYAETVAIEAKSELQLAAFIRSQVDGRDLVVEAGISQEYPDHAVDVAFKVTLFSLGLLARRPSLAACLRAVLLQGQAIVDIRIAKSCVDVSITESAAKEDAGFIFSDAIDGITLH